MKNKELENIKEIQKRINKLSTVINSVYAWRELLDINMLLEEVIEGRRENVRN